MVGGSGSTRRIMTLELPHLYSIVSCALSQKSDFSLDVIDDCMGQVLRGSQNLKESKDYKSDILRSDVNEQFEYENENAEEIISNVSFGSEELGNFSDDERL